jgi:small-conductance mechanosensitive channel
MMEWLQNVMMKYAPFLGVVAFIVLVLVLLRRALLGKRRGAEENLPRQLTMFGLTLVGLIVIVVSAPVDSELRGQILSLLGLVFTAVIALSSTTFVANAMGGLMLRVVKSFRPGDFIRIGEDFGRVTERGLFHTEIQTEDRDLLTLPNLYVITNPVKVVRSSGTIVSVRLSLGYDVSRKRIEEQLLVAAEKAGLADAFVHVKELGDFSVTYMVAGFLSDTERLLTTRSLLRARALDALHGAGIEIVSPAFMNQRPLDPNTKVVPVRDFPTDAREAEEAEPTAEKVVFDKAAQASDLEVLRDELVRLDESLAGKTTEAEKAELTARREDLTARITRATEDLAEG